MNKQINGKLVKMTKAEITALEESRKPNKERLFSELWEKCTAYRKQRISEEGMLFLFPYKDSGRAKEVYDWVQDLWNEYYTRKATIEAGEIPSFDFSDVGGIPWSFLQVRQEIEA